MFAATTTDALSVADPAILKKAPSSIPSCLDLIETPTASSWSPDNAYLYIASAHTIHRYEPSSNALRDVYTHDGVETISHLVASDKSTVIFSAGCKIVVLDCDGNPQITQTFESHKAKVNSLSVSNDNTLLVSTSPAAVHVHNLTLGSHTVLRGLSNQEISTSIFHPHSRTRLLVAAGKQLMVCDTTRPSSPMKTVVMNDSSSGDITAVACSPFSKTLVAVATSSGFVGLIDLEKEKALFRTLNVKLPLTTLGFSPEGAAIYLGTETGKILVVDLRALDKPPKSIVLSESGSRVQTISVQKKSKEGLTKTPIAPSATTTKKVASDIPPPSRRVTSNTVAQTSKSAPSPARPKLSVPPSPVGRRATTFAITSPLKRAVGTESKKVLSPVRDPHGNSGSAGGLSAQLDELADLRRGKANTTSAKVVKKPSAETIRSRPSPSPRKSVTSVGRVPSNKVADMENPRRTRTLPTATSTSAISTRKASTTSVTTSASVGDRLSIPRTSPQRRPRAASSASRAGPEVIPGVLSSQSTTTSKYSAKETEGTTTSGSATSASRPSSSASRMSRTTGTTATRDSSPVRSRLGATSRTKESRTPSPELPDMRLDPVTPVPAQKQRAMTVLGLGTPEVERWIHAGKEDNRQLPHKGDVKGKGKTVGFQDEDVDEPGNDDDDEENDEERERNLSMQISPRRPISGVSASASGSTDSWAASPATGSLNGTSPGGGSSAHELLKTIVQDVMYDFQQETKAEMMGLHLDLLRMGRGWKMELRSLMDEYVGDLRDLREENQRLRLENERLRRGAY